VNLSARREKVDPRDRLADKYHIRRDVKAFRERMVSDLNRETFVDHQAYVLGKIEKAKGLCVRHLDEVVERWQWRCSKSSATLM
jgi:hypothetical protein